MYVDNGDGAGDVGGQAGGSLWDNMNAFAAAAASGDVEVNPAGGNAMIAAIHTFQDGLNDQQYNTDMIAVPPPLGQLKGGEVMAPFMVQVATDENGFITRLNELKASLATAEEAIRQAMANYQATEDANQAALRKQMGGFA